MKTVKVNHSVLTLAIAPGAQGLSQQTIDDLVNKRLGEGYDEVEVNFVRTNFNERQEATDIVMLYVFKAYEKEAPAVKAKKADA